MANDTARMLPDPPAAPWATMLIALLVLFVFLALLLIVLHYSENMGATSATALSGEQQLQELRATEQDRLNSYGYDATTKSFNIPIDRAMNILIDEGKATGQMQLFPMKPKAK